ncbi:unnamed protein product [Pseudo-nitzschia multistriata]|uniref:Uncharacterized protein n=1 Tax=Pseudo-nitzschia multistriata TaxID=183589 RepID=A0A448ZSP9_9STRA|nr:unnamed protein product [Pseudo-nitzschia multistriata]
MIAPEEEDNEPSWLDTEKDEQHRNEVEPLLFGTGKLSLNDPDENDGGANAFGVPGRSTSDDASETVASSKGSSQPTKTPKKQDYGSIDGERKSFWTLPTDATTPLKQSNKKAGDENPFAGASESSGNHKNNPAEKEADDSHGSNPGSGGPEPPPQNYCVKIFSTITVFALVTNLSMIVSQVLPMFLYPLDDFEPSLLALKIYMCVFAIIFIVVEVDNDSVPFFRDAVFLKTYSTRGFLYTFFGLVCFELAHSEETQKMIEESKRKYATFDVAWFALIDTIAAWELISLGILYFLMGILCLQNIPDRWVREERRIWKKYREEAKRWETENRV